MKNILKWLCITATVSTLLMGCSTTEKKAAYQTLASVGMAVDNAMKAYAQGVKQGLVTPEERVKVQKAKQEFNAAYILACDAAAFNYETFAPAELVTLKNSILGLIVEVTQ